MTTRKPTVRRVSRKAPQVGKGMQFGGYVRVSMHGDRDIESESYMTERDQRSKLETWAAEKKVSIADWYVDSDVSGKTMRRPELDRLLADVRAGAVDGIAVAYLDRFSRAKVGDAMVVVQEMLDLRRPLVMLDVPGADAADGTGEMVISVMLMMSRFYSRQRGEKWRSARDDSVSGRSLYLANTTPLGYRRVDPHGAPVGPHARAARLDIDPRARSSPSCSAVAPAARAGVRCATGWGRPASSRLPDERSSRTQKTRVARSPSRRRANPPGPNTT